MEIALLTVVASTTLLLAPGPARGQTAPTIDQGEVTLVTDSSATIDWIAPLVEGKRLEATIFYGSKDGGTQESGWLQHADLLKKSKTEEKLQAVLQDLEPDTSYIYRIRATAAGGEATWSATATFHTAPWNLPWYVYLLIVVAILTVPFAVGSRLAKRFRMPDHGWKIGLILWALVCGLVIIGFRWPPKLGIDLSGGTILVYEVDQEQKDPNKPVDMDKLVAAVSERVNPGGQKEMTIRPYGGEQIEIIIPRIDTEEAKRVEKIVGQAGMLEFRILCNRVDHEALIKRALSEEGNVLRDANGNVEAWWVPVQAGQEASFEDYLYTRDAEGSRRRIPPDQREVAIRENVRRGERTLELLVYKDEFDVDGRYLTDAARDWDETGNPRVSFQFDAEGGQLFGRLTVLNRPDETQNFYRKLGVILDNRLYSAPRIKSPIYDRGVIEGSFTEEEVDDLVRVLNAGSLPTALNQQPIFRLVTGPTLGHDQVVKGSWAIGSSVLLVLVFMLFYYRFAGLIACGALLSNLVLILAIMITVGAAFTLPGMAGLVLTVGMAVDANVLIFERIREELGRGAALRMAVRNGFGRATTTIVDANVTTLITGIILFVIGTDVIKGFAITLILGVVLSMYTAIFCSRVVFDVAERRRWITELKMMRILGETQIDFLGKRRVAITFSLLVIVAGLAGVTLRSVGRGVGLLDIDFTGGVSVVAVFDQSQKIAAVRNAFADLEDLAVSDVQIEDETENTWFRINTSQSEVDRERLSGWVVEAVRRRLDEALGPGGDSPQREQGIEALQKELAQVLESKPDSAEWTSALQAVYLQVDRLFAGAADGPKLDSIRSDLRRQINRIARVDSAIGFVEEHIHQNPIGKLASNSMDFADVNESRPAGKEVPGTPPAPTTQPETGGQTRNGLPSKPVSAITALAPVLLAQAAPSEAEAPADEPAADQPSSKAAAQPPAKVTAEATPSGPPDDTGPSGDQPKAPAEKPKEPGEGPGKPTAEPTADAFAGGTQFRLTFARGVSYDTAMELFQMEFGSEEEAQRQVELTPLLEAANPKDPPAPDQDFSVGDRTPHKLWQVKIQLPPPQAHARLESIQAAVADTPYFPSSNTIGGKVAGSTRMQAVYALGASLLFIVAYIWIRFQRVIFGLAAVVALVHDVLVTLGMIALSAFLAPYLGFLLIDPFKIGLPVLAAFLTIIGYSLNDTIVVFDRIREVRGKSPRLTEEMVNTSVNQTLARTLLTSLTTLIVVVLLYTFGGEEIHAFAFALVVGVVVGTYSSVFVASPMLLWMSRSSNAE